MTFSGASTTDVQTFRTTSPFLQEDLFHCILDCLATPETSLIKFKDARPTLLSLAQTCRTFSEPALDRLWYKLGSLEPLIRCYATVLNEKTAKVPLAWPPRLMSRSLRWQTPPSSTEWTVIHRYSRRVRELNIIPFPKLSLYFLRAISLRPSLLVPNLRVLRWHPCIFLRSQSPFSITFIQRLLSPSLVSLSVTLSDPEDETLQSFLANYPLLCPSLKSVTIDLCGRQDVSPMTVEFVSRSITHYEHLEYLDVGAPIDDIALTHIATSTTLKKISLVLHPDKSNLHKVGIPSEVTPFGNAERLHLEVWDLSFVTTLLRARNLKFRSFVLCHHSRPADEAVYALFASLASGQRTYPLHSIRIFPDPDDVEMQQLAFGQDDIATYHLDTFRPLFPLSDLRELHVDVCRWLSIDDDDLLTLARNWPSLQALRFECKRRIRGYPWRSAKYVSFKGLLLLIERCRGLRELCIPLDAREIPTATGDVVCNSALKRLHLPYSPIHDAYAAQGILTRHFPSVSEVITPFDSLLVEGGTEIDECLRSWGAVNVHLREIRIPVWNE